MGETTNGRPPHEDAPREAIRVVLADDHEIVREGLRSLVNAQPDMRVVGEAADGDAACRAACELAPDVLVMDLSMPGVGGAEATACVRRDAPGVKVLALTAHEERLYLTRLLRAGASGYVLKRAAAAELVRAVRAVAAGGTYVDPAIAGAMVAGYLDAEQATETRVEHDALSEREHEVLVRIARGFSNKEIAAALGVSVKTVETYKARVAEKAGLRSRVDIVRYAAAIPRSRPRSPGAGPDTLRRGARGGASRRAAAHPSQGGLARPPRGAPRGTRSRRELSHARDHAVHRGVLRAIPADVTTEGRRGTTRRDPRLTSHASHASRAGGLS